MFSLVKKLDRPPSQIRQKEKKKATEPKEKKKEAARRYWGGEGKGWCNSCYCIGFVHFDVREILCALEMVAQNDALFHDVAPYTLGPEFAEDVAAVKLRLRFMPSGSCE